MHKRLRNSVIAVCAMFLMTAAIAAQQGIQNNPGSQGKVFKDKIDLTDLANAPSQTIPLPTTIQIDIEDTVAYVGDVPYDQLMTNFTRTLAAPKLSTNVTALGDIRQISGRAAKGLYVNVAFPIFATPDPSPQNGFSISDVTRIAAVGQCFDLQTADGTPIGSIFAWGFAFGQAAPGAPVEAGGGSISLIGGTGPYLGIRGQMYTTKDTSPVGDNPSVRFASAGESPAMRRINKGGTTKFLLQIFPSLSPDPLYMEDGRPLVFHGDDGSLVTRSNPVAPGEMVSVLARNLGPTNPSVDIGTPFPKSPLSLVSSPLDVQVNGSPADVSSAAGHPGATNVYDLEFRIPQSAPKGTATVQIFVGYVGGVQFPVSVR